MARPTSLRVLGERPAPVDDAPDTRSVVAAFPPSAPSPDEEQAGDDVLEILRRSHDRISGEARNAVSVAEAATADAHRALASMAGFEERTRQVEHTVALVGQAAADKLSEVASASRIAARERLAISASVAHRIASFVIGRAAALLALGSAFILWRNVLDNPQPIQLVALGLYGACVIGPAVWLSARKRGDAG